MRTIIINALPVAIFMLLASCGPETGTQEGHSVGHEAVIVLTDAIYEEHVLRSNEPVLVDFWAAWCQPCLEMKPIIRELAEEYDGRVKIGQMNVKDNPFTTAKYEIEAIPALLLFQDGKLFRRINGSKTKDELVRLLESVLVPADRTAVEK
ncbi:MULTISPECIES: thioredoxin family protein [Gimesia]|jgi:thioredoxin|uniref:Thioredoxin-1 n=2 Tax=Gimesia TaxID=1649453 RepID=A0A517PVR7_9PLAN|nr:MULTISPECIES: thioredoxin domain-containing protein [Gimesia]QDT23467.1 Thioredoxin-1 [Gimesia chilikensis]|tara:strand:- start:243 stop:695 length:453 start_codon:yes stop_codon:yes gene_type:complete